MQQIFIGFIAGAIVSGVFFGSQLEEVKNDARRLASLAKDCMDTPKPLRPQGFNCITIGSIINCN